jgi:RNA polymerase sigma-70 factor (ECF subfamily)
MTVVCTMSRSAETATAERTPSDHELIRRVARGDKSAMHALFSLYQVRVYRYVLRKVGDSTIAEDVVSEVFLDVWQQANRFKGGSSVSTWLLAIARHKALSAVRPGPDARRVADASVAETVADLADDPEVAAGHTSRGTVIRQCMRALEAAHAEIIDLVYYQGKSVKEISEIVRIPESTVKTRMFYARTRLAKLLVDAGIDSAAA